MGRTRFDGSGSPIKLNLMVSSIDLTSHTNVLVALDTGASVTSIPTYVAKALGYDLSDNCGEIEIVTGSGIKKVKVIQVSKLTAIGESRDNIKVWCCDLPLDLDVVGVLGYNFLEHFDINISFSSDTIEIKPIEKKEQVLAP